MKTKLFVQLIGIVTVLGLLDGWWLLNQSNADGPDSRPGHQIFLPFVVTDGKATPTNNITTNPIQIAQGVAANGRIDAFTFFIPYQADLLDDQFNVGQNTQNLINSNIEVIISVAVQNQSTVIYYDHWEDGLESNLTSPSRLSTEIWGDNNPSNGAPPGFSTDVLRAGDVVVLRNIVKLPRNRAQFFYDGGDLLTSTGGALAVSLTFWTERPPGPGSLFADAWELYPTNRWGTEYVIPIGENLAGTGPNQRLGWEVVGLNVEAVLDETTVQLDLDADGSFERTVSLNEGEQFNSIGTQNGLGPESTLVGAQVKASAPVQVHLFAANPLATYEARGYTVVPFNQWTDDYLIPRTSDGDVWLYNPDDNPLEVEVQTISQTTTIPIPGNSTIKYPPVGLSGPSGMHFTSIDERPFYGLVALDELDTQDWGYVLLPVNRLTTQALIGMGFGNTHEPPDGDQSRIYVTAASNTTIFVDYNNPGDSDSSPDANFSISPLAEVAIIDPADHDMTGAFLYTTDRTPFVAVWGQDQTAEPADPSIDAGTVIVPLPSLLLQKIFTIQDDTDCTGTVTLNDVIEFQLNFFNNSANAMRNVTITDVLPPEVAYVPNSTRLNGTLLPDSRRGTPFLLDEAGYNVGEVLPLSNGVLTFDTTIVVEGRPITNQAEARSEDVLLASDPVIIFTTVAPTPPLLNFEMNLVDPANGMMKSGQTITFSLTLASVGDSTITKLPAQVTFDKEDLTFLSATQPPDKINKDKISWNDLTAASGSLPPGASVSTFLNFKINQLSPGNTSTSLEARSLNAKLDNTHTSLVCKSVAVVDFTLAPPPTPSPIPPDEDTNDTPTPPPPTPASVTLNVPAVTPTVLPVSFLPETGTKGTPFTKWTFMGSLLLLILGTIAATVRYLARK